METSFITVKSSKITSNKKIVMLSDLHNIEYYEIIDIVKSQKPDIIAVPGDLVDRHKKTYDNALGFLRSLSKIAPTYFSFGNHEVKFDVLTRNIIKETGAVLLDNEYIKHDDIYIGGQTPTKSFDWLDEFEKKSGFKLLLNHQPEYYKRKLKNRDIDLILSGHAHGGQWRFFGKAVFAPGQGIFPKYTSGIYENKLIVSRGLSDTRAIPRICNPTQIIVIDLIK